MVIRTPDQRLRVFVSSTLGELADERRVAERAVSALGLTPVMFEQGARPHPPQELYRAYVAQSDIFIGIYWQNYGQVATGSQVSGVEEEFDLSAGLPRLLYVKSPAPDREPRLADLLSRMHGAASFRRFATPRELARLIRNDLATLLSERFADTTPPAQAPVSHGARPLPVATTSLVGREAAIDEVVGLLGQPDVRMVTLTGPGGIGKTRLGTATGERLRDDLSMRVVFIGLAGVTEPEAIWATIGRTVGADMTSTIAPMDALVERLGGGDRWLLILDNLEQAVEVAPEFEEMLGRSPNVKVLATSRTVLRLRAEHEYPVPPLALPTDPVGGSVQEAMAWPAVALFVDRARAVNHEFNLTEANAGAVVAICRRLEGVPLAIELAAARTRLLEPDELLRRLTTSLDALGTGPPDLPERQHTLRSTVEWSVGLLNDRERSLLDTVAVFVDGWTIEAAATVAGLEDDVAIDLTEALAQHSLVSLDHAKFGPRPRMLETIRAFVAERLEARPDAEEIGRRHAAHYRDMAEQTDVRLRGPGYSEWLERLQLEAGNVGAAVRWYLARDRAPLPHLFRVLWAFWFLRGHLSEARVWIDQLLPAADSLDSEARAELMWTAQVAALEVGDDDTALAADERLEPLLEGIRDPFLGAVSRLAVSWTAPIVGDIDRAVQNTSICLDLLHDQNEPFWTTLAVGSLGGLELGLDRHGDALSHVNEARDLADRFGNAWLAAWARTILATLAVRTGRLSEAKATLDEALHLSLAAGSTTDVTLCLVAYAELALAQRDPERAALLAGAADGLRRRAGLRAWPALRQSEADLLSHIRDEIGADRFDQVYQTGERLSQLEALATLPNVQSATPRAS